LELLHELVPTATVMALLVNPADTTLAETQSREVLLAAHTLGLELHVLNASSERDFDAVFANLVQLRAGGLVISAGPFFSSRSEQLAALALRHAVPTIYQFRDFAAAGGLMSYGGSLTDAYRLVGIYTGRVLKGDKMERRARRGSLGLNDDFRPRVNFRGGPKLAQRHVRYRRKLTVVPLVPWERFVS
jgi:putative tryptophan/tyrosine transport system substrate-binding protein